MYVALLSSRKEWVPLLDHHHDQLSFVGLSTALILIKCSFWAPSEMCECFSLSVYLQIYSQKKNWRVSSLFENMSVNTRTGRKVCIHQTVPHRCPQWIIGRDDNRVEDNNATHASSFISQIVTVQNNTTSTQIT